MKLITFSGIDGSGKTTQMRMVKKYLQQKNQKVFHFHAVQFSVANRLLGKKSSRSNNSNNKNAGPKSITRAGFLKIQLRKVALFFDIAHFKRLWKKLRFKKYDFVLADRYFFDQIINIMFLENKTNADQISFCEDWLSRSIKKPDHSFFVKVSLGIAEKRERQIDQGREYLEKKTLLYQSFRKKFNLEIINGEKEPDQVLQEIISKI